MAKLTNWAHGFALNHEGAGVGTIYYAKKYFDREGIINPACGEAYTSEEIEVIKNEEHKIEAPEFALVGMNVIHSDKVYWFDEENSNKILKSTAPLLLNAETGEMKSLEGVVVATPLK